MKDVLPAVIVAVSVEIAFLSKDEPESQELKYSSSKREIEMISTCFFMVYLLIDNYLKFSLTEIRL